jgi:hypothetical protein
MNGDSGLGGRNPRKVTGAVLIVIGLLLFALQIATGITVTIMFLVGGAIFIAGYFNRQTYGLLIPGCLFVGMALGKLGEEYVDFVHNPSFIGLGLGFLAIYAIDKIHRGTTPWWPLIPGAVLLFMGVETGRMNMGTLISKGWPVVLIVVGLLYFTGKIGSCRSGDRDGGPDLPAGP